MVNYTGRGLVVKRPGVLSKVQMLNLVLGVGVFSLLPRVTVTKVSGGLQEHNQEHVRSQGSLCFEDLCSVPESP